MNIASSYHPSKNNTTPITLLLIHTQKRRPRSRLKNIIHAIPRQTTTLKILPRANHFLNIAPLLARRKPQTLFPHLLLRQRIVPQILLQSDKDNRHALALFARLFGPLVLYVFERVRGIDGEADEYDVRFGVCEGSEALVVFLAGGVPEGELHGFAVDAAVGDVVFENGGDVALWGDWVRMAWGEVRWGGSRTVGK